MCRTNILRIFFSNFGPHFFGTETRCQLTRLIASARKTLVDFVAVNLGFDYVTKHEKIIDLQILICYIHLHHSHNRHTHVRWPNQRWLNIRQPHEVAYRRGLSRIRMRHLAFLLHFYGIVFSKQSHDFMSIKSRSSFFYW